MKGGTQKSPIWAAHVQHVEQTCLIGSKPAKNKREPRLFPTVELARMNKTKKLRSKLHKLCAKHGIKVPLLCFERWQCRSKLFEGCKSGVDKVFCAKDSVLHEAEPLLPADAEWVDKGMISDLVRAKMKEDNARAVAAAMAEASSTMSDELADLKRQTASGEAFIPPGTKVHACFKGGIVDLSVGTEPCKPFVRISREHFKKLSILFQRNSSGDVSASSSVADETLHKHVFCVLARYEALAGHGYQAALCGNGFDVLLDRLRCQAECFASPLNSRYSTYCSAFKDVDAPFGSVGSFFDETFKPTRGSFEANPPFVPELMMAMAQKMERLLDEAEGPLTFVVIVPAWKDIAAWRELEASKHLQAPPEVIPAASHGFCDGAQHHRRPQERFRPSSFDTGVFVLAAHFDTTAVSLPVVMKELRDAMASAKGDCDSIQAYEHRVRQPRRAGEHGGERGAKELQTPSGRRRSAENGGNGRVEFSRKTYEPGRGNGHAEKEEEELDGRAGGQAQGEANGLLSKGAHARRRHEEEEAQERGRKRNDDGERLSLERKPRKKEKRAGGKIDTDESGTDPAALKPKKRKLEAAQTDDAKLNKKKRKQLKEGGSGPRPKPKLC